MNSKYIYSNLNTRRHIKDVLDVTICKHIRHIVYEFCLKNNIDVLKKSDLKYLFLANFSVLPLLIEYQERGLTQEPKAEILLELLELA